MFLCPNPIFDLRDYPIAPFTPSQLEKINYLNAMLCYGPFKPTGFDPYLETPKAKPYVFKTLLEEMNAANPLTLIIETNTGWHKSYRWRQPLVSSAAAALVGSLINHESEAKIWAYQLAVMACQKCEMIEIDDLIGYTGPFRQGFPVRIAYIDAWIAQKSGDVDRLSKQQYWIGLADITNIRGRL